MEPSILGNQDREKTSKVDTEKWKEHRKYYDTLEKNKNKVTLEQTLKSSGKPKIYLKEMTWTAVLAETRKEYDTLMQICESAGWIWYVSGRNPTDLDTWGYNFACKINEKILYNGSLEYCKLENYKILSLKQFYEFQNITPEMIKKIKTWYTTNRPHRISKGQANDE